MSEGIVITKLNPYLMFDGTAGKAIALYEKTLGAKCARRICCELEQMP